MEVSAASSQVSVRNLRIPVRLVCLDFDGTVMAYEPVPVFHPDVIAFLNELESRGVQWCSNSGRDFEDQRRVLAMSERYGLRHGPAALICSESVAYLRNETDYHPLEPWNTEAQSALRALHVSVQRRLEPHFDDLAARHQLCAVYRGEHYTVFELPEGGRYAPRLCEELRGLLGGVPQLTLSRNGCWVALLHERLGKGNALKAVMQRMQLRPSEVLAVGDQFNDLTMLDGRSALHVGCPRDAQPEVCTLVRRAGGVVASEPGPAGTVQVLRCFIA